MRIAIKVYETKSCYAIRTQSKERNKDLITWSKHIVYDRIILCRGNKDESRDKRIQYILEWVCIFIRIHCIFENGYSQHSKGQRKSHVRDQDGPGIIDSGYKVSSWSSLTECCTVNNSQRQMGRYSGKRTKFQHVIIPNDDEKWKQRHIIWKWCRANQAHTKEVDSADHDERQVHPKSFTLRTQKCKIQRSYCRRMKPLWISYSPGIFVGISVIELEQSGQKSEREIKSEFDETK